MKMLHRRINSPVSPMKLRSGLAWQVVNQRVWAVRQRLAGELLLRFKPRVLRKPRRRTDHQCKTAASITRPMLCAAFMTWATHLAAAHAEPSWSATEVAIDA